MRQLSLLITLLCVTLMHAGEVAKPKPLIKAAKTAIKNGTGQATARDNMLAIVDGQGAAKQAQMYFLCAELERSLNEAENLKLYLKQAYDTTAFFSTILRMHQYIIRCDSTEEANSTAVYKQKGHALMAAHRTNLLNGGKYLLKRGKDAEAFPFFDMYIRTAEETDTLLARVAFWATVSAYTAGQPQNALRHVDRALQGAPEEVRPSLMEYKANCLQQTGDTTQWLVTLRHGLDTHPRHDFFFVHLMDNLRERGRFDRGIALTDSVANIVGEGHLFWHARGQMHFGKGDYEQAIECANNDIATDSTCVEAYYVKGASYLNLAMAFAKTMNQDIQSTTGKRDRVRLRGFYLYAQEPMERVRQLAPERKDLWGEPLYNIYLNLNLGEAFAEIEQRLAEK